MAVVLKSAYESYDAKDGARYLVETLWPEGVDTYSLSPYQWVHELAPSYRLKEMAIWKHWSTAEFLEKYKEELREPERRTWFNKIVKEAGKETVTLLHDSRKRESEVRVEHTSAFYLREFIQEELSNPE